MKHKRMKKILAGVIILGGIAACTGSSKETKSKDMIYAGNSPEELEAFIYEAREPLLYTCTQDGEDKTDTFTYYIFGSDGESVPEKVIYQYNFQLDDVDVKSRKDIEKVKKEAAAIYDTFPIPRKDSYIYVDAEKDRANLVLTFYPDTFAAFSAEINAHSTAAQMRDFLNTRKAFTACVPQTSEEGREEKSDTSDQNAEPAEAASETPTSGIRPEFQEAMDSYRAFFDGYAAFMSKYAQNPGDLNILMDYANWMSQYDDTMKKLDAVDTASLSDEEMALYIDTQAYASKVLLGAASAMQ